GLASVDRFPRWFACRPVPNVAARWGRRPPKPCNAGPLRSELLPEFRVSWVVEELGLFFCFEMIQVAEEFVEAVHRGQITVQIAEMILPELSRGVAERLERLGDGNVAVLQADRRAWDADF